MVAVDPFFLLSWASEPWWLGIWTSLNTIALIVTLIFVRKYTKATKDLATETHSMSKAQMEEVGLRKRPVVLLGCADPRVFYFSTSVRNFSMVHAKIRVRATLKIDGNVLRLTEGHLYAGKRIWHLQAGGSDGPTLYGHLDFPLLFQHNEISDPEQGSVQAQVTLESWVINWTESEEDLFDDKNKNPIVQWYWSCQDRRWIPEVSPEVV